MVRIRCGKGERDEGTKIRLERKATRRGREGRLSLVVASMRTLYITSVG